MVNKKSYIVLLLQLIQTFLAAATAIYIARILGVHDYGTYIYLTTATSVIPLFVGLGAEHVFIMEASKAPRLIPIFFGNALLLRTLFSILYLLLTVLVLLFITQKEFWVILLVTTGSLIAVFPNPLFLSFYRVKGIHIRPWLIAFSGPLTFLIFLFFQEKESASIEIVALGFCFSHFLTLILFLLDMRNRIKLKFSIIHIKKHFKQGIIFSISQVFDFAFARLDIFLIQFILGSYSVGIYAAGQKVVSLFQVIPSSFHVVELPEFHRISYNSILLTEKFRDLRKLLIEQILT